MGTKSKLYGKLDSGNFLFPRRIGQMDYFARGLILGLLMAFPSTLINHTENLVFKLICSVITISIFIASFWICVIPRMRDVGWNIKLAWLALIPGVNIFVGLGLLFLPPK